jgi:hypothetical protein
MTHEVKLESFMVHSTMLIQLEFQFPFFLVVVYSQCSRLRLLRKSRLQLRNEFAVSALANSLHANYVATAIKAIQAGEGHSGKQFPFGCCGWHEYCHIQMKQQNLLGPLGNLCNITSVFLAFFERSRLMTKIIFLGKSCQSLIHYQI